MRTLSELPPADPYEIRDRLLAEIQAYEGISMRHPKLRDLRVKFSHLMKLIRGY
jgi:hypothetical protein